MAYEQYEEVLDEVIASLRAKKGKRFHLQADVLEELLEVVTDESRPPSLHGTTYPTRAHADKRVQELRYYYFCYPVQRWTDGDLSEWFVYGDGSVLFRYDNEFEVFPSIAKAIEERDELPDEMVKTLTAWQREQDAAALRNTCNTVPFNEQVTSPPIDLGFDTDPPPKKS